MNVLVIGYVWPEPNSSAAGSHMMSLLRLFLKQSWQVTFASPAQQTTHQENLADLGIDAVQIALNCSSFDRLAKALNPDIVMFDRFMMEEQFGWRIAEHCPDALRIIDTEDLQSLRNARHHALKQERSVTPEDYASDLAKREIAAIYRADLALIISTFEMQLLQQHYSVPSHLLHHLPFMLQLDQLPQQVPNFDNRQHCLMIGNFRHAPNWDSVLQAQRTWPSIRKRLAEQGHPDVELHIYGAYPPPKATALHNASKGFLIKGWADNAYQVMQQARLCLAPLRFGAGIKGKLLDAMVCGTPSITSAIGAEGMADNASWPGAIADSDEDFITATVALYTDSARWQTAQEQGLQLLQSYDAHPLGNGLIQRITTIKAQLQQHRLENFTGAMLNHHHQRSTQFMSQWIEVKNQLALLQESSEESP